MNELKWTISLALIAFLATGATAAKLDWDDVTWPEGTYSQTYTNVDGTGIDITMTWQNGAFLTGYTVGSCGATYDFPHDDMSCFAGMPGVEDYGLWYAVQQNGEVSLVIEFSQPVTGVEMSFLDIDGSDPNAEENRIKGFAPGAQVGDPGIDPVMYSFGTHVSGTVVTPGNGLSFWNNDSFDVFPGEPGFEESSAWVSFGGQTVDKIGFVMGGEQEGRGQIMSDITFVPEPVTMAMLAAGSLALIRRR